MRRQRIELMLEFMVKSTEKQLCVYTLWWNELGEEVNVKIYRRPLGKG